MIKGVVRAVHIVSLGLWVGGMATLGFIVAPALFRAAPSRALAGRMFGTVLGAFGPYGIVLGLVALLALGVWWGLGGMRRRTGFLRMGALVVMLGLSLGSHFGLGPAIERERASVPQFDALPPGVPARARFESLHRASVGVATATLVLGIALLACSGSQARSSDGA